jgi:GNAT superfamily N-acetyltransferase
MVLRQWGAHPQLGFLAAAFGEVLAQCIHDSTSLAAPSAALYYWPVLRQLPTIRDFKPADQEIVRWPIIEGLGEHWGSIHLSLNQDLNDIQASFGHGRILVAEDSSGIVGTGTILPRSGDVAEIVRMSVSRSSRGTGVGQLIASRLVDVARVWNRERVIVETASHWTEVVVFYQRCGFQITHEVDGEFCRDTFVEFIL